MIHLRGFICLLVMALFIGGVNTSFAYTVTGPAGNTVGVSETAVGVEVDGVQVVATEDDIKVENNNRGGGGSDSTGAVVAGVLLIAVAAGLGYWYYNSQQKKTAALLEDTTLVKRKLSESASLELAPRLASGLSSDENPSFELADLAAAELSLKIKF